MVKAKKKIKKTFAVHHWCGLVAGIFLLVISLTGSILVFDDDIDDALFAENKKLSAPATQISFDQSFDHIRRANPGWEIRIPELPTSLQESLLYELRQGKFRRWIFVHPSTGEVLSKIDRADLRFTYILLNIHYNLLSGTPGKFIVFLVGVAFLVSLMTGIIVYRRSFWKVLYFQQKISFQSKRSMFSSLHRVLGVWGLLLNFLMCITGLFLGYLVIDSALKNHNTQKEVPELAYSIDEALAHVQSAYPDFDITYLRFPVSAEGKLQLLRRLNSDPLYYGKFYSGILLDGEGNVEKANFLRDSAWYARMLKVLQPLHFGDYAGIIVKIIYSAGAMVPALLSVTGFFLWRKRSSVKPVVKKRLVVKEVV